MSGRQISVARFRAALASTGLVALVGCTTLGGNVKGSFACAAPDGICAPSSSIDDRALAMIAGEGAAGDAIPAGSVIDAGSKMRPSRTAAAGVRGPVGRDDPQRTQERVLRIVFQPYVDQLGRLHEASAVHAVVENGGWRQQLLASSTQIPARNVDAVPLATETLAEAVDRADGMGAALASIDPNLPDPAVVAAARARVPVIDPVEAIKTDVAARLAPKRGRTPPRVVSKTNGRPVPVKSGGMPPAAATVKKGATDGGAATKIMAPDPSGAAPAAKTGSADEAIMRVKATTEHQTGALGAESVAREAMVAGAPPAAKPIVKAPVRAAGFPGAVRRTLDMAAGFFDDLLAGVFGDSKRPDAQRPGLGVPMHAHWLPYRSYDPKTGIFYNSASRGFVIEAAALVGADERTGEILAQFLPEGIPAPGCLQFHQWMSPRVGERLSRWYLPRYSARGVYERMAKHRVDFLTDGVWDSLSADAPFCLRNHRVAISYSTPETSNVSVEQIVSVMGGLISSLQSVNVSARRMDPSL